MSSLPTYQKAKEVLTKQEKIGQLFMPAAFINDSEEEIQYIEQLIEKHTIGGLCFFHSRASAATNFEGQKKIRYNETSFSTLKNLIERYQNAAKYRLLISIDAEWGLAMRIENTPQYPYAITLGAIQNTNDLTFQVGKQIAKDCKVAGIHWNLAPVVDINNNPNNPVIGYRSFGEDKNRVAQKALAFVKGTQSEGVLTCLKHFPGHGDTGVDSHLGLPLITKTKEELLANELYPFQKIINEGVDSIMAGHLSIPALADGDPSPSSLSKKILKSVLRDNMKFNGVVISDALNMFAVSKNYPDKGELEWRAFDAGNDILCFAEHTKEGIEMILKKATDLQIEESFERVWKLKQKAFIPDLAKHRELSEPDELNRKIAEQSLSFFKGDEHHISKFSMQKFIGLEITMSYPTCFLEQLKQRLNFDLLSYYKETISEIKHKINNEKNVLIALYPPKAKPANFFDIPKEAIDFINEVLERKNVILYLFGNPYALHHLNLKRANCIVVAYQNFTVFEEHAVGHFLGENKAIGKIPVSINS